MAEAQLNTSTMNQSMEPEPQAADGTLVWVTGWPGCGKSTVGYYLAQECGFAHIDVDTDFSYGNKEEHREELDGWFKSWRAFFSVETPAEADFSAFMMLVIDRVHEIRTTEPGRNIVVTQGIHRPGRDFARRVLGEGSGLRFIGLTAGHEANASRLLAKERHQVQARGFSLEDEFKERTGEELTEASFLAEYMSKPMHSASNRKGMDTDEGEANCDRVDIGDDGTAVLHAVRSLLDLPTLDGAIDHTAAAETVDKKLEEQRPWAEGPAVYRKKWK